MTNNNYASVARYNAHTEVAARASTRPFGAIPGLASLNLCGDLRVCNYQNLTTEHFLARQLSPLSDGVMAELINANWPALDTSGTVWKSSSELGYHGDNGKFDFHTGQERARGPSTRPALGG